MCAHCPPTVPANSLFRLTHPRAGQCLLAESDVLPLKAAIAATIRQIPVVHPMATAQQSAGLEALADFCCRLLWKTVAAQSLPEQSAALI
mmetsp:Transcript_89116/g.147491  ORF Transcript_89116/g.147491 Transcript_89116/m.147491 type:complete len:90 (+) Transcript_89116:734-1003(+)